MNIQPRSDEHLYIKQPGSTSVNVVDVGATGVLINGGLTKNGEESNDKVWNTNGGTRDITTSVTQNSTALVTSGAVWTAIDNLPEPMVFRGTLGTGGTITALPVDGSAKVGDTYKVITTGTYAGVAAKVGDVFTCNGKTASANTWVYIPAGDDVEDTWRNVLVNGTEVLGTGISSGGLKLVNGTLISPEWNSTNTTIQFNHNAVTRTGTTSAAAPAFGGTFTAIDSVTSDSYGHVTAVNTKTVTLPVDPDTQDTAGASDTSVKIYLVGATSQSAVAKTYSDDQVYVTSGKLHANRLEIGSGSATGANAVAEGYGTASGSNSHAEGYNTKASGEASHAEGAKYKNNRITESLGQASHAEGASTYAKADGSHAEGVLTTAGRLLTEVAAAAQQLGITGTQIELVTKLAGYGAHAEGTNNNALGSASHAEGNVTNALANSTHAEGDTTTAFGEASHAEGYNTRAKGNQSHAEGQGTVADGNSSHAEGWSSTASGSFSHAEGSHTESEGRDSHAEGAFSKASGIAAHTEGNSTIASGEASHAEGYSTGATGYASHAEGINTVAAGRCSHAGGQYTIANQDAMTAIGMYNETGVTGTRLAIGNGTNSTRKTVFSVIDLGGNVSGGTGVVVNVSGNINTTGNVRVGATGASINTSNPIGGCNLVYDFATKALNFEF